MTETEQPRTVEASVFNTLTNTLSKMGFSLPTDDLSRLAAQVTRRAFEAQARQDGKERAVELRAALHRLWELAGEPSTRQMGRDLGMSHMTWHTALRCEPVPPWGVFSTLVRYLDGNPGELEELWMRAKGKPPVS